MRDVRHTQRGFIALMATIIISLVLLVMAVKQGNYGWSARFNVLGTEAKEQASALAEGCAEQALAALITNPNYTGDTDTTTVGGVCHTFPVQINFPVAGLVTIKTQAVVRGSYANLDMAMHMNDLHLGGIPTAPTTGTLFITTHVINDSSGSKQASDFTMNVAANPSSSFAGTESGQVVTVQPGAYSISETALTNYAVSSSVDCSGTIVAGGIKFCTITNDDITTTLTLIANVVNDNGGTMQPKDFVMNIDGTAATLGTRYTVTAGSHTVTAVTPTGYGVSPWGYDCTGGGTITMSLGQNKTCIINFDDIPPPAPSCAETVMILDRTGSMSNTDLTNESNAAKALTNLYAGVLPPALPPKIGVGSIGGFYGNTSAQVPDNTHPVVGWLTTTYSVITNAITQLTNSNSSVGSDLSAGIVVAGDELNSARHVAGKEKVLILVSDGDPNEPSGTINASVTLAPNAEAASTAWNANTGTKVSAIAVDDDDTSYVSPALSAQTYGFANAGIPAGATNITVTLHAIAKRASGTTATVALMAEGGGNTALSSNNTLSTSYVDYTWAMNTNPLSGSAWTAAEVNAWTTKFGALNTSASGNVPRITQMYVVVDYAVVSSGNSQKSPTAGASPNNWSGATQVATSNNAYATSATNGQQQGLSGFGLSVPAGATITGISVTTEAKISGSVSAINTGTLYPNNDGNYTAWNGNSNDIDETGSPSCSSGDYIDSNSNNARSSFTLNINSIPDGSTINSISITPSDRGDSSTGGTYKTFVRINGTNTDAGGAAIATNSTSGCTTRSAQTITPSSVTKNSGTTAEIGVLKVNSGGSSNNTVRIGALNAVINYTPPSGSGSLAVTLSSNGGSSWSGTTRNTTVDTTESIDAPSGNSSSDLWGRTWVPSDFTNFALRVQNNSSSGLTMSLDQVIVTVYYTSATPGSSAQLAASSVGAFSNWPPNTGTAIAAVATNDNDNTSISNTPTSQASQTFIFPNANIPAGASNISVTLHAIAEETNGTNGNIRLMAEKGASQYTDGGHSLSGSYTDYTWTMSSNPSGGSWSVAEVNAWTMRFGVRDNSTAGTIPRATQVYAVVSYTTSTDPTQAALAAADAAKLGGINIFTIHFGGDPSGYTGKELLANLANGSGAVTGHQNGSVADPGGVITGNTGLVSPTAQAATSGGDANGFESNSTGALTDGPSGTAGAAQNNNGAGDRHIFSGYNFTIPPGATVTGIQTRLDWWLDSTSGTNSMNVELSWNGGTTWTSAKSDANESTSVSNSRTLGATNDVWGHAWTASELSPANFRVRVTSNGTDSSRDFYLDWIPLTVSYSINQENGDGDNFFVAPTSADMQGIFNFIGQQVCPAALNLAATPPPTTGSIIVITQVINNNSGSSVPSDFTSNISATNPSQSTAAGNATGVTITVDPGNYNITQNPVVGYTQTPGATCTSSGSNGPIAAGETRVCVLTDDDIPPPPPPPNLNLNTGTWREIPTAN